MTTVHADGASITEPRAKTDTSTFAEIADCAGRWVTEAGERLSSHARGSLHIEYKGGSAANPVSEADREAEDYLYSVITERYPDHSVIGEEGKDPGLERHPFVWVVDPLDGTANYLHGLSLWCVSAGVLWYGAPVAGAIYAPMGLDGKPALFVTHRGGGTTLNGSTVRVDPSVELRIPRLAGLPEIYQEQIRNRKEYRARGEPRTLGTIALELALTACGALQFAAFWVPRIWDVAAGVALVTEAGGTILRREDRDQPWHPFRSFEVPQGHGLRAWRGGLVGANPTLAPILAERIQAGKDLLAPIAPDPATQA